MDESGKKKEDRFILWFDECGIEDVPLVGGKNASLGEMIQKTGVPVPFGFAITSYAYRHFIRENQLENFLQETLKDLKPGDIAGLQERGKKVREKIRTGKFPSDLESAIRDAYKKLGEKIGEKEPDCAVRSSATAEDLPDASFAGQQDTYLHQRGIETVLRSCNRCIASLFTDRAIHYRMDKGFDHFSVALSVGVQIMVRSDIGASGVIFSIDTESGFEKVVYITASWGLGEYVVQGKVNPDQYYVFKPTLGIISKKAGYKDIKLVYDDVEDVKEEKVPEEERYNHVLNDDQIKLLADYTIKIENHYNRPMDIEWGLDGVLNKLFILQARPETIHSIKDGNVIEFYKLQITDEEKQNLLLLTGEAVGRKIGQGKANVIVDINQIMEFKKGEVLITVMTDPDWEPIMKKAAAIVTETGGRTCHAAIVSRELGIPCVIGTGNATGMIKDGQEVTADSSEGIGRVLNGIVPFEIETIDVSEYPDTRTKIFMNVGIPEQAFDQSKLPADGVGLARLEFIINSHIQIHPLALININALRDYLQYRQYEAELLNIMVKIDSVDVSVIKKEINQKIDEIIKVRETIAKIDELTPGYENKEQYFVDILSEGVSRIAAAFYPGDVVVRLSDFKTNEYANLIGGFLYEPHEHNPMIGWRGASRYYSENFLPAFRMECRAMKRVRDVMGLTNVKIMVPFCRTPEEGRRVVKVMNEEGLVQGNNDLQIYVMAEIPSNIILADEFSDIFDAFSIGSNDLTQLTLGLDRDSDILLPLFDERSAAVTKSIKTLLDVARSKGRSVSICGQAPSDYPSMAAFLVRNGIRSISLNPDTVIATRALVKVVEWCMENNREYDKLTMEELVKIPGINEGYAKTVLSMIDKEKRVDQLKSAI